MLFVRTTLCAFRRTGRIRVASVMRTFVHLFSSCFTTFASGFYMLLMATAASAVRRRFGRIGVASVVRTFVHMFGSCFATFASGFYMLFVRTALCAFGR